MAKTARTSKKSKKPEKTTETSTSKLSDKEEAKKIAQLFDVIWRGCEGDVSNFIPSAKQFPGMIKRALRYDPGMSHLRAELLAILQKILNDRVE